MDSQWLNQEAATKMNGYDQNNDDGNTIDLTLKLGLPNSDNENQHLSSHERINNYKMANEGMNSNANIGQRFNPNEIAWPQSNLSSQHSQAQYMHPNNGYGLSFSTFRAGSSSMGSPLPNSPLHYDNLSINPDNNLQLAAAAAALASMKGYTLINVPASRNQQLGTTASSSAAASAPRRAAGIPRAHGYPYKRCTNYNCNTNDTPMWRRGPLGPKTLCNACGIKYRKEEEKRKAKETETSNIDQDSNNQTAQRID